MLFFKSCLKSLRFVADTPGAAISTCFNRRRIYGRGVHPPFTIFFDFRLRSLRYEKNFLKVLSKLSQASMVKNFHFSDEWKVVSVAPQRGGVQPPINLEVFFTHILATASRLNTSHGLENLHHQF